MEEEIKDKGLSERDMESKTTSPKPFWEGASANTMMIAGAIVIAGLLVGLAIIYSNGGFNGLAGGSDQAGELPSSVTLIDDDTILGDKKAKLTIVEFSDFQCPYCRKFWQDTFPEIKKEYIDTGKVNFVYRDYPLSIHPMANPSAEATECADEQGKYWQMHDKIFAEQAKKGQGTVQYTLNEIKKWASEIGLDTKVFNSCLDTGKFKNEVAKDLNDGTIQGVQGTPAFFIGSQVMSGAYPFAQFKIIIEEELAKAK